jgi:phosphoadenosine phosphosulfate reductase
MEVKRKLSTDEISELAQRFENSSTNDLLKWALDTFHPNIAFACSFGAEDVALVDMLVKLRKDAKIFYLDTGLFFKETYDVRDKLIQKYGIQPLRYAPEMTLEEMAKKYGPELWKREPDTCCKIRKVEPLKKALGTLDAWITGIRREQAPTRANAKTVEWDAKFNLVKVNPLVKWTWKEIWDYIHKNNVPYNALHDKNYPSIGCEPCTAPVKPGEDPRSGRWKGFDKTECGLHK